MLIRMDDNIAHGIQTMIVTANPEILLEAQRNPAYWSTLRQADVRCVDGFGLQLVGFLKGARPCRIAGVELAERLLQTAVQRQWSVALIGGDPGNADKAAWMMREAYPQLRIFSERGGMVLPNGEDDEAGSEMRFRLTQFAPDILLIGFAFPGQESWIARHLSDFPSVKVVVGIGGTIDYWSGAKKRAPQLFRSLGLEWLWRLIQEPQRWKRIVRAVIVFPVRAIWDQLFPLRR